MSAFIRHYSDLCTKTKWRHRQKRPQAGSTSVLITECKFQRVGETSQNKSWFRKKMEIYVRVLNELYTLIWRVTKRILSSGSNSFLPTPTWDLPVWVLAGIHEWDMSVLWHAKSDCCPHDCLYFTFRQMKVKQRRTNRSRWSLDHLEKKGKWRKYSPF